MQDTRKGATNANPAKARELKAKGLTIAEIAKVLEVSERTVSSYLFQGAIQVTV